MILEGTGLLNLLLWENILIGIFSTNQSTSLYQEDTLKSFQGP